MGGGVGEVRSERGLMTNEPQDRRKSETWKRRRADGSEDYTIEI